MVVGLFQRVDSLGDVMEWRYSK